MKKLMIAAVAVASAFALRAADVNWRFNLNGMSDGLYKYGGTELYSGTMYVFDQADVSYSTYVGQAAVLAAIKDYGSDWLSKVTYDNKHAASGTVTDGVWADSSIAWTGTVGSSGTDYISGSKYYFFGVVVDDGNVYISPTANKAAGSGDKSITINPTATSKADAVGAISDGYSSAGWYTADVPEPTSGLLLLLGVAGLALRRRRA